jgi:nucleoside-diphosphate-sugar epimerase
MVSAVRSTVLVTGGAGYIGSVLVPRLVPAHRVIVLDAMWFGNHGLMPLAGRDEVRVIPGDIRDRALVDSILASGVDTVIHLAAVSNDPCSELDPQLTTTVNLDATRALMQSARRHGVRRFINASSASVYGIKEAPEVTEELPLAPLTLYARYKAETEEYLRELCDARFTGVSVRAATVCGYSPRLRLDLTINILSYQALTRGELRVFGGAQQRPNVHVEDLCDFYAALVTADPEQINGGAFNVVAANASVLELAHMVRDQVAPALPVVVEPSPDHRSYRISGRRAERELGFRPRRELAEAVRGLRDAFADGRVPDPHDARHRNVEVMKRHPERVAFP